VGLFSLCRCRALRMRAATRIPVRARTGPRGISSRKCLHASLIASHLVRRFHEADVAFRSAGILLRRDSLKIAYCIESLGATFPARAGHDMDLRGAAETFFAAYSFRAMVTLKIYGQLCRNGSPPSPVRVLRWTRRWKKAPCRLIPALDTRDIEDSL